MDWVKEVAIEEIARMMQEEFRDDPALQQVHVARKIIAKEAKAGGMTFVGYIKSLSKQSKGKKKLAKRGVDRGGLPEDPDPAA